MQKALYLAQLIADAHPDRVRLLYQANGITAPVNAKSIMDAYLVLGTPFLMSLFEIAYSGMNQAQGVDGTTLELDKLAAYQQTAVSTANELAGSTTKTSFWDGFSNVFNQAGSILTGVAGAYESISGLFGGGGGVNTGASTTDQSAALLQAEMLRLQQEQAAAAAANKTKTWLLIAAGLVVAVLVVVMIIKKK